MSLLQQRTGLRYGESAIDVRRQDVSHDITSIASRLQRGDHDALRECYENWSRLVYTIAYRAIGNREEAEDVTQQVFVSAWKSRETITPSERALPAWLLGITRRRIADYYEQRTRLARREQAASQVALGVTQDPHEHLPGDIVAAQLLADQPEPRQTVLRLAVLQDHTHAEISEKLDMPLGTVKSHVRRGLAAIKAAMEEVQHA